MDVKTAVNLCKENEEVQELLEQGGFLCAVHTMVKKANTIDEWKLSYYSPETKQIMTVTAKEDKARVDSLDKPLREVNTKINVDEVEIPAIDALKTATDEVRNKFKQGFMKILFSLQKDVWSAVFFTVKFDTITVTVDYKTGKVVKAEEDSLLG